MEGSGAVPLYPARAWFPSEPQAEPAGPERQELESG